MRYFLGCLLLLLWPTPAFAQESPQNDYEQFVSYPYMERGYRLADDEEWQEVESLMRHLLSRVSDNREARRLLAQALTAQGEYASAEQQLATLQAASAQELLMSNRLDWIDSDPPDKALVTKWLATTSGSTRASLWRSYAETLTAREGKTASLNWLLGLGIRDDGTELRRYRAALAEELKRWGVVLQQLAPLRRQGQLMALDWKRLVLAHLARGELVAANILLEEPPSMLMERAMLDTAADRAIALERPAFAELWLQRSTVIALPDPERQQQRLELARQRGDASLIRQLSREQHIACWRRVQWLLPFDRDMARRELALCDPSSATRHWLYLASRLEADELLAKASLPQRWQEARQTQLVELWQRQGKTQRALDWLARQSPSKATLRLRARLWQAQEQPGRAAEIWERLYWRTGEAPALEQASYLWVESGNNTKALQLLERAFDRADGELKPSQLARLASLYSQRQLDAEASERALTLLKHLEDESGDVLLRHLATSGQCRIIERYAQEASLSAQLSYALGTCAMPSTPGTAVVYFQKEMQHAAPERHKALAYALFAARDPSAAYEQWRKLSSSYLASVDHLAMARSALAVGKVEAAVEQWKRTGVPTKTEDLQLGVDLALKRGEVKEAMRLQRRVLSRDASAPSYYAAASTARQAGQFELSRQWLAEAARRAPDEPLYQADYGMSLAASESDKLRKQSIPYLVESVNAYPEDYILAEALAQRYVEVVQNEAATDQLRRAIDLEQRPLAVGGESAEDMVKRRYRQRRQHASLRERDRVSVSSTWSPVSPSAGISPTSGEQNTQVALWDHALGKYPSRNGRQMAVYARAIMNSDDYGHYGQAYAAGAGLRIKPLGNVNLNLYGEIYTESTGHAGRSIGELVRPWRDVKQQDGSSERTELLLRATASFLDQGQYRGDWRPTQDRWQERSLYLGAAWWTKSGEKQLIARYRHGPVYKLPLSGAQTLMPYLALQGTALETEAWREDMRVGAGLRWRYWFDADRYNAYRGAVSLRLEYQQELGGSLYGNHDGWLTGIEVEF